MTPSAYWADRFDALNSFNVGWLGADDPFEEGAVDPAVLDKLWEYCQLQVLQTRGRHLCELCAERFPGVCEYRGEYMLLGTAEIRVFSEDGKTIFAVPNLIFHYVVRHSYRPPKTFLSALMNAPGPSTVEYLDLLKATGLEWRQTPIIPKEELPNYLSYTKPIPGGWVDVVTDLDGRALKTVTNHY